MSPERKPPHNVQVLQRWVGELARQDGIAPARLQRWISFMVVAGLLTHARDETRDPLFVLKGWSGHADWPELRAACEEIFALRNMHPWPPVVTVFDGWTDTFTALATEVDFPISDVHDAAERVQQLIQRITAAVPS